MTWFSQRGLAEVILNFGWASLVALVGGFLWYLTPLLQTPFLAYLTGAGVGGSVVFLMAHALQHTRLKNYITGGETA